MNFPNIFLEYFLRNAFYAMLPKNISSMRNSRSNLLRQKFMWAKKHESFLEFSRRVGTATTFSTPGLAHFSAVQPSVFGRAATAANLESLLAECLRSGQLFAAEIPGLLEIVTADGDREELVGGAVERGGREGQASPRVPNGRAEKCCRESSGGNL